MRLARALSLLLTVAASDAVAGSGVATTPPLRSDGPAAAALGEAGVALLQKDSSTARVKLLDALSSEPAHVGARVALASLARDAGLPREALRLVDEALAREPENSAALNLRGLLSLDDGKLDDAVASFLAAEKANPKNPDPALNLGEMAERAADSKKAILQYQHALVIDSGSEIANARLAELHARRGEADDAIRHAEAALAKNARNPQARSSLGAGLSAKGDWEPAIAALREARSALPADAEVNRRLGAALMGAQRWSQAADAYLDALDLDDADARSHLQLGICYYMTRNAALRDYARKEFQHVADRNATAEDRASSYYHLALLDDDEGKAASAEDGYRLALRTNPNHAGASNNLGLLLSARGAFADAIPWFRRALRLQPAMNAARLNLGNALLQTGKTKDARKELEPLLALPDDDPLKVRAKQLLPAR